MFAPAAAVLLVLGPGAAFAGSHDDGDAPQVESSGTSAALEALPRLPVAQRKIVTIYQFRSGVAGIQNQAAADMFTNALMESGAFLVAERQMMADLAAEKGLNATGRSDGDSAQHPVAAAQYIFEGAISEDNETQDQSQNSFSLGGITVGGQSQKGKIAIDVRVVDANTGLVMDSIAITKVIRSGGGGISGSISSMSLAPGITSQSNHNDGVDAAVRACIEAAVLELVKRYGGSS
jgi:curli biogenesis system outer membrane secretion channel CsgG